MPTYRRLNDTDDIAEVQRTDEVLCIKNGCVVRASVAELKKAVAGQPLTAVAPAGSWTTTAPYTQNVQIAGVTENDVLTIGLLIPNGSTGEEVSAMNKAYACLDRVVTKNGYIQLYCYNKRPSANFTIMIGGL